MRILINSMIVVMLVVIAATAVLHYRANRQARDELVTVRDGLQSFDDQLAFQSALWQAREDSVGDYPPQVMPGWFDAGPPSNPLLKTGHPWIDIAPPDDFSENPPDPLAENTNQAGFWYNPNLGIVRARVPRQVTDEQTLELYNRVNRVHLAELPDDPDPDRVPLAFDPTPLGSGQLASPTQHATGTVQAQDPLADATAKPDTAPQQPAEPWYKNRVLPEPESEPAATAAAEPAKPAKPRPSLVNH